MRVLFFNGTPPFCPPPNTGALCPLPPRPGPLFHAAQKEDRTPCLLIESYRAPGPNKRLLVPEAQFSTGT